MDGTESETVVVEQPTEAEPQPVFLVGDLARLDIKPGDRLVVKLKKSLPVDQQRDLFKIIQAWAGPEIKVMVIDPWITLGVIANVE